MKIFSLYIIVLLLFTVKNLFAAVAVPEGPLGDIPNPFNLEFEPLKMKFPEYSKIPLIKANAHLYFARDQNSRFFRMSVIIPMGRIHDRKEYPGETHFTVAAMVRGGTQKFPVAVLDSIIDLYSISITHRVGYETSEISVSSLDQHREIAADILREILNEPAFDSFTIEHEKRVAYESVLREVDEPNAFISMRFREFIYGNTPYGTRVFGDTTTIRLIDSTVIAQNFKRLINRGNHRIVITSPDLGKVGATKLAWSVLGDHNRKNVMDESISNIVLERTDTLQNYDVIFYNKKGLNQIFFRFGHRGLKFNHPLHFHNLVMLYILGTGGFNSRLVDEVRVRRGLTYSVGFSHTPKIYSGGHFGGNSQTAPERFGEAIEAIYDVFYNFKVGEITQKEFGNAQRSIVNQLPFLYESVFQYVSLAANYDVQGRDRKIIKRLPEIYSGFTVEDIKIARDKLLSHPNEMKYVFLGELTEDVSEKLNEFVKENNFNLLIINVD